MLRRNLLRLLALTIGLGAGLLIMEIGIRLWPWSIPPAVQVAAGQHDLRLISFKHPVLGYALEPGVVDVPLPTHDFTLFHLSTQALDDSGVGFRTERLVERPEIVMVGDSFAMGWGVEGEQSFAAKLERATGASLQNLGVVGYGPQQTAHVLENYGLPLRPRLVLWVLYGNDFQDAYTFDNWVVRGRPDWWLTTKSPFDIWFSQNCSTYKLYKALAPYRSSSRMTWEGGGEEYVFVRPPATEVDLSRPEIRAGLDELKRIWTDLAPKLADAGTTLAVVSIPHKEIVYRDVLADWEGLELGSREQCTAAADEALAHARELGFQTLDLLPFLEQHRGEQLYFPIDAHFTPRGNQVVGERLAAWLQSEGLLDGGASAGSGDAPSGAAHDR